MGGHTDCVKHLLKAGADVNHKTILGETLLMLAVRKNDCVFLEQLQAGGAGVNQPDEHGNTALMLAISLGKKLLRKAAH